MNMCDDNNAFIHRAVCLAVENVRKGGGPFAAIIVRDGKIVAEGVNSVTLQNDPTAHAEVNAIRAACSALGRFNLEGCVIYTSCEPCPMCLAAIYWAHIDKIYYAACKNDAADAGFDDSFIYEELSLSPLQRSKESELIPIKDALLPFDSWRDNSDRVEY